ncbi:MAG: GumC family protein [Planctomycetota bacterium]
MAENETKKTPRDILRVVFRRRRLFLLSASLFIIIALIVGHYWPVKYTGATKFERRSDPAMEEARGRGGSQSFETIKLTLGHELAGQRAVERAFEELGLARGLPHDGEGHLTKAGRQQKQEKVRELMEKVSVSWDVRSENVDLVSVSVTHSDPSLAQQLPDTLVKNYISLVSRRIRESLTASRDFLLDQVQDAEDRVKELTDRKINFETKHAGTMPESPGALQERIQQISSDIDTLRRSQKMAKQTLARLGALKDKKEPTTQPSAEEQPREVIRGPNPELKRLQLQLTEAEEQLNHLLTVNHMTEKHPTVLSLKGRIEQLEKQISETPEEIVIQRIFGDGPRGDDGYAAAVAAAKSDFETATSELVRQEARLDSLQALMANFAPIRQEYLAIVDNLDKAQTEADTWRKRLTGVEMKLAAEVAKRRTHLDAVEAAQPQFRPSSPKPMMVIGVAFIGGLGFAAALVFLANMLDRTLSTPEEVQESFGVPVCGVIGEIKTTRERITGGVGSFVVTPILGLVIIVAIGVATFSLTLWLKQPENYKQWRAAPIPYIQQVVLDRTLDQPELN